MESDLLDKINTNIYQNYNSKSNFAFNNSTKSYSKFILYFILYLIFGIIIFFSLIYTKSTFIYIYKTNGEVILNINMLSMYLGIYICILYIIYFLFF